MSFLDIFKSKSSKVEIDDLKTQILKYNEIIIDNKKEMSELKKMIEFKEEKYKVAYENGINLNLEIEQSKEIITNDKIEISALKKYIGDDKEKYRELYEENVKLKLENNKCNESKISLEGDIARLKSSIEQEKEKNLALFRENTNLKLECEKNERMKSENKKHEEIRTKLESDIDRLKCVIEEKKEENLITYKENINLKLELERREKITESDEIQIANLQKYIKKENVVNERKEFFKVTLEEVEKVVRANYDKSVDFVKIPEAQQYRESLKIKGDLIAISR